jgi:pimeloyl-ACP methyl ester carboxylesterase
VSAPEPFEVSIPGGVFEDLRQRLAATNWFEQPSGEGWDLGVDVSYLRELCSHWATGYDEEHLPALLNQWPNRRWEGLHLIHAGAGNGPPVVLLHGWPSGPLLYAKVIPLLLAAGHEVIVPSLPGFAWSDDPGRPLSVADVSQRLRDLIERGLGHCRYAVSGQDWGAAIAARMALDAPDAVAALHIATLSVLPPPGDLEQPPLSAPELDFLARGQAWRRREGFHLFLQTAVPDALAVGLADSPAGLAAWLVEKYRRWSDCEGDVERRFSKDDICDFLTMYWATGTIASSMRLYLGERRSRWRFEKGQRIAVPAGVAVFPADIVPAPRDWAERIFSDLRLFTEMPRGGHFSAWEEPQLLVEDMLALLELEQARLQA